MVQADPTTDSHVRLAEVVAALSLATDLGVGQPLQHALRACLLAVDLAASLGLAADERRDVFYVALLQRVGCTADAFELAAWFDDELAAHARTFTLDFGRPLAVMADVVRHAGAGRPPLRRLRTVGTALATGKETVPRFFAASCEVAVRLTARLGFDERVQCAVGQVFERWDGRGWPAAVAGEAILPAIRIARLVADAEVFHRLGGLEIAIDVVRRRVGTIYDPAIAEHFCRDASDRFARLDVTSAWDAVMSAEPGARPELTAGQLDDALRVMADFVDLKSPFWTGHSSGVADLAIAAGAALGLTATDLDLLRRAGLVHDLGRASVPNGIWDKPGPLTDEEWERVRLHPYHTERILARSPALARIGALAALHHERLDGSGYLRGLTAAHLSATARLLAAADAYHAMTEPRPYRPPLTPNAAAGELQRAAGAGTFDGDAVGAVLAAAGHRARVRRTWPAGLSDREVDVLRLVARGLSNPAIARHLSISPHTAGHHVRHLYDKIGVSSRAAAALFAMQHDLLT